MICGIIMVEGGCDYDTTTSCWDDFRTQRSRRFWIQSCL